MNYKDDWFCKHCKKQFKEHVQIGAPKEEGKGTHPAHMNWCFSVSDVLYSHSNEKIYNSFFEPVDNLSYIEYLAKRIAKSDNK